MFLVIDDDYDADNLDPYSDNDDGNFKYDQPMQPNQFFRIKGRNIVKGDERWWISHGDKDLCSPAKAIKLERSRMARPNISMNTVVVSSLSQSLPLVLVLLLPLVPMIVILFLALSFSSLEINDGDAIVRSVARMMRAVKRT